MLHISSDLDSFGFVVVRLFYYFVFISTNKPSMILTRKDEREKKKWEEIFSNQFLIALRKKPISFSTLILKMRQKIFSFFFHRSIWGMKIEVATTWKLKNEKIFANNSLRFHFSNAALVLGRREQANVGELSHRYFNFLNSFTRIICNMYIHCYAFAVMVELLRREEKRQLVAKQ